MNDDCLYTLPDDRYKRVTEYFKSIGGDASCHCPDCNYFKRRVMSKKIDPRDNGPLVKEYDTPHYQAYLRSTRQPENIPNLTIMQINQFEELLFKLFGGES